MMTTFRAWLAAHRSFLLGAATALPLALAVVFATRADGQAAAVPQRDRAAIEAIIREYILSHPEIIPEAINGMQAREVSKLLARSRKEIETPFAGAVAGPADADVTVVEFFDYACPYCRSAQADLNRLLSTDPKVRVVYRDFPVLSDASTEAAMASLSAANQNRYAAFHNRMFNDAGRVGREKTIATVRASGLDEMRTAKDLTSPALKAEIKRNLDLGRALGLTGTPSFVVGNRILSGSVGYDALVKAVATARAEAKAGGGVATAG